MDLNQAVTEASRYLKGTPEFLRLKQAREILSKTPKANSLVSQFLKKQEALHSGNLSQSQAQYLIDELTKDYENLIRDASAKNYFGASEDFGALLDKFMHSLNASITKELA